MKLDPTAIIAIVVTVLHAIPWLLTQCKLTKAAAVFAHYTPTINALLPKAALVVADVVEAPKGERGAVAMKDLGAIAEAAGNGEAAVLLARVAKMLGIGAVLMLIGCTDKAAVLRGAIDASNVSSHLEVMAAPVVESQCVAPMKALAAEPHDAAGHQAKVDALDAKCKPLVGSYDTERHAHLVLIGGVSKAETDGSVTLGVLLGMAHDLDVAVGALVKELGQ